MLTTASSSPVLSSAPSSPNTFRSHAHAQKRGFAMSSAAAGARRQVHSQQQQQQQHTTTTTTTATTATATATTTATTPQAHPQTHALTHVHKRTPPEPRNHRTYRDQATQYTPPGLPPTYRAPGVREMAGGEGSVEGLRGGSGRGNVQGEGGASEGTCNTFSPPAAAAAVATPVAATAAAATTGGDGEDEVAANAGTPAKRARPPDPALKAMPRRYEVCDVKVLGVLVADMLMELVRLNDGHPLHDGHLTRFHSRAPPGISVRDYLQRLIVHATLSPPILLSMVFYVDKLCTMYPAFTISSLTVHRFLITAATVAAKGLSDSFWTNTLYARVGGVSVRELALLELEFLRKLEWRIVPKPEVLVDYYRGLVERAEGYVMEEDEEDG